MNNKPILAFDCATGGASVSLQANGKIATRAIPQNRQAAELVSAIDALMREAAVTYPELSCIVTTTGPGSFTGLRIGLAALHGLVLVNQTPIKTLTTLAAMAWKIARAAETPKKFAIAMRAGKGEVYVQDFTADNRIPTAISDIYLKPETFTDWPLPCFANHIATDSPRYIAGADSEIMCKIASQINETALAEALPLYIRAPDAVLPTA